MNDMNHVMSVPDWVWQRAKTESGLSNPASWLRRRLEQCLTGQNLQHATATTGTNDSQTDQASWQLVDQSGDFITFTDNLHVVTWQTMREIALSVGYALDPHLCKTLADLVRGQPSDPLRRAAVAQILRPYEGVETLRNPRALIIARMKDYED